MGLDRGPAVAEESAHGCLRSNLRSVDHFRVLVDTASTMMQHELGSVDNTAIIWEMRSEFTHPQSKQRIKKRSIISIVDDNRHTIDSFMQTGEAAEFKVMQIDFRRSK